MAKVNINGMVFEGTNDELLELFTKLGAKIPAVEEAEEPAFKVGDYVKTLTKSKYGGTKEGEIVRIEQTNFHSNSGHAIAVRRSVDSTDGLFRPSDIIHATDEEIAEAKRQQDEKAVAAKWAAINRKPNEFKKGDIVRGVRYNDTDDRFIGELEDENGDGYIGVRGGDGRYHAVRVGEATLITPVEARFDR